MTVWRKQAEEPKIPTSWQQIETTMSGDSCNPVFAISQARFLLGALPPWCPGTSLSKCLLQALRAGEYG